MRSSSASRPISGSHLPSRARAVSSTELRSTVGAPASTLLRGISEILPDVQSSENIRSSDPTSELMLTVAATIAEDDLKVDSERQRWSFKRRFENGWMI